MYITVIVNPKGGSGKTTLITNIAGYYASQGHLVFLKDADRQQSVEFWLNQRPQKLPTIYSAIQHETLYRSTLPPHHVFIDTPAGLYGQALKGIIKQADQLIVPIQPSGFDIDASQQFLATIRELKHIRKNKVRIALIGMRVAPRTKSAQELEKFLSDEGFPVLGFIRESQLYVQMAHTGYSLFDQAPAKQAKETPQWRPIVDWLHDAK